MQSTYLWKISKELISHNTVSFLSNSAACTIIANELSDLGFKTFIDSYDDHGVKKEQVIAWIGPEVEDGLILSGHIDTVPFENQKGWTKNPLQLTLENDKIFGRGTVDMKLFIAHCLAAFKEVDLSQLHKPLVCIFTSDEEIGCCGANRLTTKLDRILGEMPIPKRAVIGEPTEFNIINTHKGIVQFDTCTHGVAGHSSRPDLGENAIEMISSIIDLTKSLNRKYEKELSDINKNLFPDFPHNHLHLAKVNAGEATNMIPNRCEMNFSYRTFPSDDPKIVLNDFTQKLAEFFIHNPKAASVKLNRITKAMPVSFQKELEHCLIKITAGEITSAPYATDGGEFSTLGIQSYICGPGSIKQAHMPDEFITVDQFLKGKDFVKGLIQNLLL